MQSLYRLSYHLILNFAFPGLGFTPKILSTLLVSARTGYGIETLINKIFTFWKDNEVSERFV